MVGGQKKWMVRWIKTRWMVEWIEKLLEKDRQMVGWTGKKQKDGWRDRIMDGTVENGWMVGWIDKTNIWMVGRKTKI